MIGLLDTLTQRARQSKPQQVGRGRFFFSRHQAGVVVDHDTALSYVAVWSAVRIISETMASMPWQVIKREADGTRTRMPNHPLNQLLNVKANSDPTTAFDFLQTIISHVLLWGNGYAEIDRTQSGNLINLWGLPPDQVTPRRDDSGRLVYDVRQQGGDNVTLPAERMLHFRGLSWDGIQGYSVINTAARAIGLGLATEQFGADFFANGAHAGGVLEHPGQPDDPTIERMRDSLRETVGPGKWLSPLLLEDGIKWVSTSVPPDDAQFLQTRKFQVSEIARLFRVPPHKLADLERATFSNIGEQSVEFVTDTISPWAVRFEQEIVIKLLPRQAAQGFRVKINLSALLRGDIKTRYEAYKVGREWGWQSIDDIRRLEDMNPIGEEKGGSVYIVPLNFQSSERLLLDPPPVPGGAGAQGPPGQRGATGAQGADGVTGAIGERGESGVTGEQGPSGQPGGIGADGPTGATGDRGEMGNAGEQGMPGQAGAIGADGATGVTGDRGESGNAGEQGPCGQSGADGAIGVSGQDGEPGEIGPQGASGISGSDGKPGKDGDRGPVGYRGDSGRQGNDGIGLPGPDGAPGPKGDPGVTTVGRQGEKGTAGPPGVDAKPYGPAMRDMLSETVGRLYRRERAKIGDLMRTVSAGKINAQYRKLYEKHVFVMTDELLAVVGALDELACGRPMGEVRKRTITLTVRAWSDARCGESLQQLTADGGTATLKAWESGREAQDVDSLIERFAPMMMFGAVTP